MKKKVCICYPFPAFTRISSSFAINPDGKREKDSSSEMQLGCPQLGSSTPQAQMCGTLTAGVAFIFTDPPLRLVENFWSQLSRVEAASSLGDRVVGIMKNRRVDGIFGG